MRRPNNQNTRPDSSIDHVTIVISDILSNVSPVSRNNCIFRVHHQLRKVQEMAYEPVLLAIVPYSYHKDNLRYMEEQKARCLKQLLERKKETSIDQYVHILSDLEERARGYYAETISLARDEFVVMMLIDGCFIIELFRKHMMKGSTAPEGDPIFEVDWVFHSVKRDLLLLENQLPLFVLEKLFEMTKSSNETFDLIEAALNYLEPSVRINQDNKPKLVESKHLLDLIHKTMLPEVVDRQHEQNPGSRWKFIPPATELKESGVKFKAASKRKLPEITFKDGLLEVPTLEINDHTEAKLRNLLVYEQHAQWIGTKYITDYVTFMDCLISSPEDVEILRRAQIIEHYMGYDQVVSDMFNKMGDYITLRNFLYRKTFRDVNAHCGRKKNRWLAKLRRDYFHSPWSILSLLAALALLLLTATQTVHSLF